MTKEKTLVNCGDQRDDLGVEREDLGDQKEDLGYTKVKTLLNAWMTLMTKGKTLVTKGRTLATMSQIERKHVGQSLAKPMQLPAGPREKRTIGRLFAST